MNDELMHYGTPHAGSTPHSGRYPWGSGDNPGGFDIRAYTKQMRADGMNDTAIAKSLGMSTKEFRENISIAKEQQRAADSARALSLKDHGYSVQEIAKKMGMPQSTVRNYLDPTLKERANKTSNVADVLKSRVGKNNYIDVGKGAEIYLNVSDTRLNSAVKKLVDQEGYTLHYIRVEQAGNPGKSPRNAADSKAAGSAGSGPHSPRPPSPCPCWPSLLPSGASAGCFSRHRCPL